MKGPSTQGYRNKNIGTMAQYHGVHTGRSWSQALWEPRGGALPSQDGEEAGEQGQEGDLLREGSFSLECTFPESLG